MHISQRFVEEQLKLAGTRIDKLNLKIVTANRQIQQAKKEIAKREEIGKTLRPVDFEQLRIQNEYVIDENEVNHRLISSLKRISGNLLILFL